MDLISMYTKLFHVLAVERYSDDHARGLRFCAVSHYVT